MGQHKTNPNCKLASEGKLPPKKKAMSRKETEAYLRAMALAAVAEKSPGLFSLYSYISRPKY